MKDPWGRELVGDEADTVSYLSEITGHTTAEIVQQVSRSWEAQVKFQVAVSLAAEVWDYLDGTTGKWSTNSEKQDRQLRSYASTLFEHAVLGSLH